MKLYVTPGSPYARMARIVVIEKGLEKRVEVIFAKTRTAGSPYYQINPSGRVPYLVRDDGVGMEESALICAWLDQLDGKPVFSLPAGEAGWEARRLARLLPRAELVELEGLGHMGPVTHPDLVNERIRGFLERHAL